MKIKNKEIGYVLLIISSIFMLLVYSFWVLHNITNFDVVVIKDLHNVIVWIIKQINKVQFIIWLLFLISLVYVSNIVFHKNVNRIMNSLIVLTIIVYVVYRILLIANTNQETITFFGSFYSLLYTIFCLSFIIFLIVFEPKLNFGILLLTAFILQIFVLEIPFLTGWYNDKVFKFLGVTLKVVFQGLSYLLFAVYGFKRTEK